MLPVFTFFAGVSQWGNKEFVSISLHQPPPLSLCYCFSFSLSLSLSLSLKDTSFRL